MNRNAALGVLGAAATWAATVPAAAAVQPLPLQLRTMRVPFDHDRPEDGGFSAAVRAFAPVRCAEADRRGGERWTAVLRNRGSVPADDRKDLRRAVQRCRRLRSRPICGRAGTASAHPTAASIGCSRTDFCAPVNGSATSKRCAKHCSVRMASCCCTVARAER